MDMLYFVTSCAFFIWVLRMVLYIVWLLQKQEFRLDRIRESIFFTSERKNLFPFFFLLGLTLSLLLYVASVFSENAVQFYQFFVCYYFWILAVGVGEEYYHRTLKIPVWSFRTMYIFSVTYISVISLYFFPLVDMYLWLILIAIAVYFIIGFFFFAISFPGEIYEDIHISTAKQKLLLTVFIKKIMVVDANYADLTAYCLNTLLTNRYKTLYFYKSFSTLYNFARNIMLHVPHYKTQVIIASFTNDFEAVAAFFEPDIVVHGNSLNTLPSQKRSKNIFKKPNNITDLTEVTNIEQKKLSINFSIQIRGKSYTMHAPVIGGVYTHSLFLSIYAARTMLIPMTAIKQQIAGMRPMKHYFSSTVLPGGALCIDATNLKDTGSLENALQYLQMHARKKVLVFTPDVQTNKAIQRAYEKLGKTIANVCDYCFLLESYTAKNVLKGFYEYEGKCIMKYGKRKNLQKSLERLKLKKDDIIIFLGFDVLPLHEAIVKVD